MEDKIMLPILKTRTSWPNLVDELFNDSYLPGFFDCEDWKTSNNVPAVNVFEGKDDYRIEVAAPGLGKEDFKVSLDNDELTISSEKESKNESKEENILRKEFSYSSFKRTFTLPDSIQGEKIKASHKDGILTVTVPKKEEAKVKPVKEIRVS
jgi:HSP20 family protein